MKSFIISLLLLSTQAIAADCPEVSFSDSQGKAYLWQHRFADGVADLVISLVAPSDDVEIRRVTYGGSLEAGCHYQALAISRGGDWGWHVAWSNSKGVFYARMDGEAWVSSPPKKIAASPAGSISFRQVAEQLGLEWTGIDGAKGFASSADEGRSW